MYSSQILRRKVDLITVDQRIRGKEELTNTHGHTCLLGHYDLWPIFKRHPLVWTEQLKNL